MTDPNEGTSTPDMPAGSQIELEKYRIRVGFYKFLLGTVALGLLTSVLTHLIQQQELDQEKLALKHKIDIENQISKSNVQKLEQAHLGKFIDLALSGDIEVRVRFAHYFKSLTSSPEHQARWKAYHGELQKLRTETNEALLVKLAELQVELDKTTEKQTETKIVELQSVIQQQTAALRPTNTVDTPIQTREVENVRQPRGIRNNNPFNLPAGVRYAGLASPINMTPSQAAEARYAVFQTPEHGISAGIAKIRQDVAKAGKSDVETVASLFSSPDRADQYAKYLGRKLEVLTI